MFSSNILSIFFAFINLLVLFVILNQYYSAFTSLFVFKIIIATIYFLFAILSICLVFSDNLRIALISVVFFCYVFSLIFGAFLLVLELLIAMVLLSLLIWGISYIFIGRKEFGKKHQLFVTIAFSLAIVYKLLHNFLRLLLADYV